MSTGLYIHRTRNAGEIVRDTMYNPAHKNHQINDVPDQCGALSDTTADFQTTLDPAPGGVVTQVDSVLEEFQQLRFAIADIKAALNGGTPLAQWYVPITVPPSTLIGRGARVYRNTTQSLTIKTSTACVFNTTRYDTGATDPGVDAFWDVGQPTRLTATAAGLYQVNGFVQFATGASGPVAVFIRLNGSKLIAASEYVADGTEAPWLLASCQYMLALNDYVELVVFQNANNPLNAINPEFGLELLNPSAVIAPPTQFTLQVSSTGTGDGTITSDVGGISCPGTCAASFADGSSVVLTPSATVGGFVEWQGDVPSGHETDNPLTVTMDQARTISALFTAYTLTISEAGTGSGNVTSDIGGISCPGTCSALYAPGDVVQLTHDATAGVFGGWSGDVPGGDEFDQPLSITMSADKSITATFNLTGVLLSHATGGSAALSGTRYINPGAVMTVNATRTNVEFKAPIDLYLESLSVTMVSALAVGHTVDCSFTIGGVDDATITVSLVAGEIDKQDDGSILVAADTTIVVKAVQVGGGGDNIQSLAIVYRPA